MRHNVFIALGSNIGNRALSINQAVAALRAFPSTIVHRTSHLYETAPQYLTSQPRFLNAVVQISTELSPLSLLSQLKSVERNLGRQESVRFGPRIIDLDLLAYDSAIVDSAELVVPHPRIQEREFVLGEMFSPLSDLAPDLILPKDTVPVGEHHQRLKALSTEKMNRILPLGSHFSAGGGASTWNWGQKTYVMGILNVTPDSFSDGGKHVNADAAAKEALRLWNSGAHIVDVGGESTRPMSSPVSLEQELDRVLPVIECIRKQSPEVVLSIDTTKAKVAEEAIKAGAMVVNDVSGGTADQHMLGVVAELGVPYILMHMRGNSQTMRSVQNTSYDDVVRDVHASLLSRALAAEKAGINRWNLILDPGVGFALKTHQNLQVIGSLSRLRPLGLPLLVGPSKKGFLGELLKERNLLFGEEKQSADSSSRQWATAGIVAACASQGADIVRVHDLPAMAQMLGIVDSVTRNSTT
jgi:dihydropteroate synthase/2-amino-4-hydroxy-6-hydroxymethyldihydropteridine diphosphokinase